MKRQVIEYLPFLGIVIVIVTTSWLAGRSLPQVRASATRQGRRGSACARRGSRVRTPRRACCPS
ncbi:hypothetical protein SAMN05421869_12996 [Nonomuraea jiangxiensis]|uniref:Uncharacterized protein n=1 Tax=Nonomuraea jiangxiensis TaxID=633440 RepID=A0A1G9M8F4_9ACTN|nr:hypothetical protein SAMN05421869_12996 [Nonomuraea jiangxiensis]